MGGWYLLVLFVLLVGMTCGWALPSCVEEGERQIITQQASALLAQAASPQMPLAAMLLTAMLNALRTVGLLFVGSLSPYLAVFSGIALWAKGFGIGFTLHGMQLAHGFGGLFLAFVMLALQNTSLGGKALLFCRQYLWCLAAILAAVVIECIISPLLLRAIYGWIF